MPGRKRDAQVQVLKGEAAWRNVLRAQLWASGPQIAQRGRGTSVAKDPNNDEGASEAEAWMRAKSN